MAGLRVVALATLLPTLPADPNSCARVKRTIRLQKPTHASACATSSYSAEALHEWSAETCAVPWTAQPELSASCPIALPTQPFSRPCPSARAPFHARLCRGCGVFCA